MPVVDATAPMRTPETVITADNGSTVKPTSKPWRKPGLMPTSLTKTTGNAMNATADQTVHQQKPDPLWHKCPKPSKAKTFSPPTSISR